MDARHRVVGPDGAVRQVSETLNVLVKTPGSVGTAGRPARAALPPTRGAPVTGVGDGVGGWVGGPVVPIPTGSVVMLVGPPASGKSMFAAELVRQDKVDAGAVLSSDDIAVELFGPTVDRDVADPEIFAERDRRLAQRLATGQTAVVDATNVLPQARAQLAAIARRFGAPVVVLRFGQPHAVLAAQNAGRDKRLPARQVREYAALMAAHATAEQLRAEGACAVHDVPGRDEQVTPAQAAHRFVFV